jgi:2',3'-cyclic-nucleotide 2'-phosphodiesterase / 3'-nucleotidase
MLHRPVDRRTILKGGVAAAALLGFAPGVQASAGMRIPLRLMATSDLHVNVFPYDYYRDRADDTVGLAKTAALVKQMRESAPCSMLFDNGDLIQGSPMGDYMAYEKGLPDGVVHPMVAAMNALGYDCGTLGNHEFNYGLDYLGAAFSGANFPAVCANVIKADGTPLIEPFRIERKVVRPMQDGQPMDHEVEIRIGVIGFVPPQIVQWDKGHLDGRATTIDIVEAAERYLPKLAPSCDIVVALCHSGIAGGARKGGEENAALHLASLSQIDVIITGHQHLVFPGKDFEGIEGVDAVNGTLHGKPAVMPGFWGSHLGVIDLELYRADHKWQILTSRSAAVPIYERAEDRSIVSMAVADPAVLAAAQADHDATLDYVRRPVGETTASINSYWALVADDPSVQIVSQAQLWYGGQLADAAGLPDLPMLSAAAPFKSGGRGGPDYYTDVKPGPIAIKDVADIYLYPNTLRIVQVTGGQVREWLERSAGIFNRIDPAATGEQALIDPAFPAYNFDVIDGVTYRIDVTQPRRYDVDGALESPDSHRIVDLTIDGRAVADDEEFLVVTNNYRAGGGGNFPGADGTTTVLEAPDTNRDVIVRYIVSEKTINPSADANWGFVPWPDSAVVTVVSSPSAAGAPLPAGVSVERAGDAENGFVRYRVMLAA